MCFATGAAHAQSYPERGPIKLIVPYAPGGATDNLARWLGVQLGKALNQTVIVDNKPGAGAIIGGKALATSAPDGYTLGVFEPTAVTVTPQLYKKPPYEALRVFQPVTRLVDNTQIVVVPPSSTIKTFPELVRHLKEHPDTAYGTSAAVGITMLDWERLSAQGGFKATNVPYRGSAPLLQDVMAGQIPFAVNDVASVMQHVKGGKLRPLAVTSKERHPALPDTPTMVELGYAGFESVAWFGVLAPADTPNEIVTRLNTVLNQIGRSAEFKQWAAEQGFTVNVSKTPNDFIATMKKEMEAYRLTAARLNISVD